MEKAKLYLSEAHIYFDFVKEARRNIDGKIYNMIVLSGVLINIVFGLGYLLVEQKAFKNTCTLWLMVVSTSLYFAVTLIGLILYQPQDIATRDIKKVIEKYERTEEEYGPLSPMQHIAWNLCRDAEYNSEIIRRKAVYLKVMLVVFAAGLVSLISALGSLFIVP